MKFPTWVDLWEQHTTHQKIFPLNLKNIIILSHSMHLTMPWIKKTKPWFTPWIVPINPKNHLESKEFEKWKEYEVVCDKCLILVIFHIKI